VNGRGAEDSVPGAPADPQVPAHVAAYQHVRRAFGDPALRSRDGRRRSRAARDSSSAAFAPGRDPRTIGDALHELTAERGWDSPLARAALVARWPSIVGEETAAHASPIGMEDGELIVRCDSTAWAQQLRTMRAGIVTRVGQDFPAAGVVTVRFLGPDAPSWKRGPRTIPGRGPRDTYG